MDKSEKILNSKFVQSEISIIELCKSVFKKIWLLILAAAIAGGLTLVCSKDSVTQTYISSYKNFFYTENNVLEAKDGSLVSTQASSDVRSLMQIYKYVATNDSILQRVIQDANVDLSADDIISMLSIQVDEKDTIATVSIQGENPDTVYAVAVSLNNIVGDEIMNKIENCKIETLVPPSSPDTIISGKSPVSSAVIVAALVFFLTAVVIVIAEIILDKVKMPRQLEERTGIIVLSSIPKGKNYASRN